MARPPNHVCVYKDVKVSAFVNSPKKGMQTVHLHYQDVLVAIMIGETTSKDPISILLKPVGLEKLLPVPQILRRRLLPDPDINTAGLVIMQNPEIFENCEK
ncbi:MAG: hypothetical protein U1A26_00365 [Candidatus Sungbacteria bacterium]|nr:hypothetical protein [Candidatus Sungbacteria bacterium]